MPTDRTIQFPLADTTLIFAGIIVMLLSATADVFYGGSPGFGSKQFSGLIFGAIVSSIGLFRMLISKRRIVDGGLLALYFFGLLYLGLKPGTNAVHSGKELLGISSPPLLDFVINFVGFVPFSYLIMSYVLDYYKINKRHRVIIVAAACGIGVSLMLEMIQYFIPGRTSSFYDCLANTLGVLVGICFCFCFHNWSQGLKRLSILRSRCDGSGV